MIVREIIELNSTSKQNYLHLQPTGENISGIFLYCIIFGVSLPRILLIILVRQNIGYGKQTLSNTLKPT